MKIPVKIKHNFGDNEIFIFRALVIFVVILVVSITLFLISRQFDDTMKNKVSHYLTTKEGRILLRIYIPLFILTFVITFKKQLIWLSILLFKIIKKAVLFFFRFLKEKLSLLKNYIFKILPKKLQKNK